MKKIISWLLIGSGIFVMFHGSVGDFLIGVLMIVCGIAMLKGKLPLLAGVAAGVIGLVVYKNLKNVAAFKNGVGVIDKPSIIFDSPNLAQIISITQLSPDRWSFEYMNFTSNISDRGSKSTSEFKTGAKSGSVSNHNFGGDPIDYRIFWNES